MTEIYCTSLVQLLSKKHQLAAEINPVCSRFVVGVEQTVTGQVCGSNPVGLWR